MIAIQPSSESFRVRDPASAVTHRGTRDGATRRSENKPNPRAVTPNPKPETRGVPSESSSRTPSIHASSPIPRRPESFIPNQTRSSLVDGDRSKGVRTLTLLTDRRVIVTIVVAVDARHAACIIDIDIGIESIDRVLSSRSLHRRRRAHPTTTTTHRDDRTLGPTPSVYLPPSTSMGLLTISTT